MFGKCPHCNAKFKKPELAKLSLGIGAYQDKSCYAKCYGCGRFFVPNMVYAIMFLVVLLTCGITSCVFAFLLDAPPQGMIFGFAGFFIYLFRGQIHQYLPVVDVSDTDLMQKV